jgi:MtN3 and saliva related transmembrane protein
MHWHVACIVMRLDYKEFTGIAASIFTSSTLIPQVVKILREKSAKGVSPGMLVVLLIGLTLWVAYGIMINDWIITIANSFSLLVNIFTIVLWFKYRFNH